MIDVLTTAGTAKLTQETLRKLWTAVRDYIHNIKTCTHLWTAVRDKESRKHPQASSTGIM
jgi:hypothetical protein